MSRRRASPPGDPSHRHAHPTPGADRGGPIIASVEAFFAIVWFGWGPADPPGWLARALVAASVLAALVGAAGIVAVLLRRAMPSRLRSGPLRDRYLRILAIEVVLIGAGAATLAAAGQLDWLSVWVAFVVGAHFVPLARLLDDPTLRVLGMLICLTAAVAVPVALRADATPAGITGPVTGILLLGAALLTLAGSLGATPATGAPASGTPRLSPATSESRRDAEP